MKNCIRCKIDKDIKEFYIDRRSGKPMSFCKKCKGEETSKWWKSRKYGKVRYERERERDRERHLVNKYGITGEDYNRMLNNQKGMCAICSKPEPTHKRFDVDHCHSTGIVRGLLCTSCNRMLGHCGDNIDILISAIKYLKSCRKLPRNS